MARVFSQKHSSTFVGIESLYQMVQIDKIECLAGVSWEGLTREILIRHSCLHPILTLHIPVICKAHASLRGKLSREIPARTLLASIA